MKYVRQRAKMKTNQKNMRVYNPEGSTLRKDQKEMMKALVAFAEICEKNDIQWWLCSGTLLGAARHKGFIPWDDDMDVSMLKKDYRKLEKILAKMDNEEYFYQCIKTDPDHVNAFGKFRKKKDPVMSTDQRSQYFKYQGVGLDVFCIEKSTRFASHSGEVLLSEYAASDPVYQEQFPQTYGDQDCPDYQFRTFDTYMPSYRTNKSERRVPYQSWSRIL